MQISKISKALEKAKKEHVARTAASSKTEAGADTAAAVEPAVKPKVKKHWAPSFSIDISAVDRALHAFHERHSLITEEYRIMRTNVRSRDKEKEPKVLLFSSSVENEGKTISALNYAYTLACDKSKRILIIDADLRKGTMSHYFGISASQNMGMSDVLMGQAKIEEVLTASGRDNLHIVFRGKSIDHPAEAVESSIMKSLIKKARAEYDYVIIDAPPVLPVTDAAVLSQLTDGVVLIVKLSKTPKSVVKQALETFKQAQAKMLGCVLTNVEYLSTGYKKYYYYDSYGSTA